MNKRTVADTGAALILLGAFWLLAVSVVADTTLAVLVGGALMSFGVLAIAAAEAGRR